MRGKRNTEESFWALVDRSDPDGCWPWMGKLSTKGYGRTTWQKKRQTASRVALLLTKGIKDPKNDSCHTCDNPPCCRPDHLFEGSRTDNMQDAIAKGRFSAGDRHWSRANPEKVARGDNAGRRRHPERYGVGDQHPSHLHPEKMARGEAHGLATLTYEQVRIIRGLYAHWGNYLRTARELGIPESRVRRIIKGETWKVPTLVT